MTRINVYARPDTDDGPDRYLDYDGPVLEGYFDRDKATEFAEDIKWNGNARIGTVSHQEFVDEFLYLTAGGRWVRNRDAHRCNNGPDAYWFITPEEAREWLLKSGNHDEAIKKHFGEIADEEGPNLGGRPVEITNGQTFPIKFPRELVERVDTAAREAGLSRAGWLRQAAESALTKGDPA
jgi:hypothetical protein